MAYPTVAWSEATPAGTDDIRDGDDRIRELKTQIREILDVDHVISSSGSGATWGNHNQVTLIEAADIGSGAEGIPILGAQTVVAPELCYTDENDDDVILTDAGYVALQNGRLPNDTYMIGRNNADDGDIDIIKVNTSDQVAFGAVAVLADASLLATSAAPTTDAMIANKKYVDDMPDDATLELSGGSYQIKDAGVAQAKLKTALNEISGTSSEVTAHTGGEYSFSPQFKESGSTNHIDVGCSHPGMNQASTYLTASYTGPWITFSVSSGTTYSQTRYVAASGTDYWIFLLVDNDENIVSASAAPDHPSYGNGGDPEEVPHPFGDLDTSKHRVILLDKATCNLLVQESKETEKSILTLVNEEYKVNGSDETYQPLHSGKFLGEAPVMIDTIPSYIKVRKLNKLSPVEKQQKEDDKLGAQQAFKLKEQKKERDKSSAINKLLALGLELSEVEALRS